MTVYNPVTSDITISKRNSIKWSNRNFYYQAITHPQGKAITILDRENCTFLNPRRTDPIGTASMFAVSNKTTVYIASERTGTYNKAYRIDDIVQVPSGCTLRFMGGSIKNCYLYGSFIIDAEATEVFDNTLVDESANNYSINIKWFGAKGDGRTDDTESIRRAVHGKNSITVFFPKGQYVLTGSVNVAKSMQHWVGESVKGQDYIDNAYYKNSEFVCLGTNMTPYVYAPKQMDNLSFFRPKDREGSVALMISRPLVFDDPHLNNVYVSGFDKGLHIENVAGAVISKCDFRQNNIAVYSMQRYKEGVESGYVTDVRFEDCKIIYNDGYAFYKDFYNEKEIYAPDRVNIVFEGCTIEFNAKNVDAEISHKHYSSNISRIATSLGNIHFIDCNSESTKTFIKAENSYIQFDNCFFWCNSLDLRSSSLVLNNSRFPYCTLICAGNNANFKSSDLINRGSSIRVNVNYSFISEERQASSKTNLTGIPKVEKTSQIPIGNVYSGDRYYDLELRKPVYVYKWKDGDDNSELFDALGDRIADEKSGPTSNRPKSSAVLRVGFMYFDTTLNKPIWWNGKGWVDCDGKTM